MALPPFFFNNFVSVFAGSILSGCDAWELRFRHNLPDTSKAFHYFVKFHNFEDRWFVTELVKVELELFPCNLLVLY